MQNIQMVDLHSQYASLEPDIDRAIKEVLQSCQFINGEAVKTFAEHLANYLGVKHVIPCANGTDALQIALMALGLKPGDEVITTPFTFVATAEVIALLQLKPVFIDVNPCTFTLNEYLLEQVITEKTKAIIPVHLFGQAANMEAIMRIAKAHEISVIEDNAQAIGADFLFKDGSSKKLGTIGRVGCTSFFPSKNLGGYGDGGALFTDEDELAVKIRMIANHGSEKKYYHDEVGVNSRLDTLQAAILNVKLAHLDNFNRARQAAASYYTNQMQSWRTITTPKIARYSTHVFHQYTILIEENRDAVQKTLMEAGISTAVYYPVPLHLQKAYQNNRYQLGDFPVSEELSKKVLSLPMHTALTEDIQQFIIQHLEKALLL
ncbi:MAG: DegT/DnrJ/EryC1/StrS family aminotransferase [Saprospiraceae bacterium]|nr:DegT/DnrJ/EryC1/StrS family aminotransferase [Saprospiraceae bacterium]